MNKLGDLIGVYVGRSHAPIFEQRFEPCESVLPVFSLWFP